MISSGSATCARCRPGSPLHYSGAVAWMARGGARAGTGWVRRSGGGAERRQRAGHRRVHAPEDDAVEAESIPADDSAAAMRDAGD